MSQIGLSLLHFQPNDYIARCNEDTGIEENDEKNRNKKCSKEHFNFTDETTVYNNNQVIMILHCKIQLKNSQSSSCVGVCYVVVGIDTHRYYHR